MKFAKPVSALLALSMGCATIDRGPVQRVFIESEPPGAAVELEKCGVRAIERQTPIAVYIPRRVKRCTVLLLHDGYEPARVMLERRPAEKRSVDGIAVVDTICGPDVINCTLSDLMIVGTLGALVWGVGEGVDALAGSNYELEPRNIWVHLQADRPTQGSDAP